MVISLVLATFNRTTELERFLKSLCNQTYQEFELIVVDQNCDDRLNKILQLYTHKIQINHLRSEPGLSKARNIGLTKVTGQIVGFPDDDCWYEDDTLERVVDTFARIPDLDGLTGRTVGVDGTSSIARFDRGPGRVTTYNVWRRGVSITIFLTVDLINNVGSFDESLGAGAGTPWGSGEETDYLIRCIRKGAKVIYDPKLYVGHPNPPLEYNRQALLRAERYAPGMGKVLRKNNIPFWFVLVYLIRPLIGSLLSLVTAQLGRAIYYWMVFRGRLKGWSMG